MGAAAYNRGSRLISEQIDREQTSLDMRLLSDLSAHSAAHHGARPFESTVVRFGPKPGEFSVMNRQRGGWGERAYVYPSLWHVARDWRVAFVEIGRDEHSDFIRVAPV